MAFWRNRLMKLWETSHSLTFTTLAMVAALLLIAAARVVDARVIGGDSVWLKPAKFALASGIYAASIAWVLERVTIMRRFRQAMAGTISAVIFIEVVLIGVQAARGTTSHFNVRTPLDAALFQVMGVSIITLLLASIGVLVILLRQRFDDAIYAAAIRTGLAISLVGAAMGGVMTRPTPQQMNDFKSGKTVAIVGAHTVGAPDGGAGLPGVGWSRRAGDLRVPHFFGLHALQLVPLLGFAMARRVRHVYVLAGAYLGVVLLLFSQAMRGVPLLSFDLWTVTGLAAVLAVAAVGLLDGQRKPLFGHSATLTSCEADVV